MSLTSSSNAANYSSFSNGYDRNPIGSVLNIVPFSYKAAVGDESAGLQTQVQRMNSASKEKASFMSTAASSSTQQPAFALADLQRQGFAAASPQNAGNVINTVKDGFYATMSAQAMSHPPKMNSGYAPPTHYTSVYKGREGAPTGTPGGVVAPTAEAFKTLY